MLDKPAAGPKFEMVPVTLIPGDLQAPVALVPMPVSERLSEKQQASWVFGFIQRLWNDLWYRVKQVRG